MNTRGAGPEGNDDASSGGGGAMAWSGVRLRWSILASAACCRLLFLLKVIMSVREMEARRQQPRQREVGRGGREEGRRRLVGVASVLPMAGGVEVALSASLLEWILEAFLFGMHR